MISWIDCREICLVWWVTSTIHFADIRWVLHILIIFSADIFCCSRWISYCNFVSILTHWCKSPHPTSPTWSLGCYRTIADKNYSGPCMFDISTPNEHKVWCRTIQKHPLRSMYQCRCNGIIPKVMSHSSEICILVSECSILIFDLLFLFVWHRKACVCRCWLVQWKEFCAIQFRAAVVGIHLSHP